MFKTSIIFVLIQCVLSKPIAQQDQPAIPIVSQTESNDGAGNYGYSFETGNGIKESVQGSIKQIQVPKLDNDGQVIGQEQGVAVVQSGTISYPSPDGTVIELS